MSELQLKFNQLDVFGQQEVMKFVDFLLQQKKSAPLESAVQPTNYSQRILQVSVWSEDDLKVFDPKERLLQTMHEASKEVQANGLTFEELQKILSDDE